MASEWSKWVPLMMLCILLLPSLATCQLAVETSPNASFDLPLEYSTRPLTSPPIVVGNDPNGSEALPQKCTTENFHANTTTDECAFVKLNCAHAFGGYIDFMRIVYCCPPTTRYAFIPILCFLLTACLYALSDVAYSKFVGSLERVGSSLNLRPNAAGVLLLAFGNGAPDISVMLSAMWAPENLSNDLGIGVALGAGLFVSTIVAAAVACFSTGIIDHRPFLRDVMFYLLAVGTIWYIIYNGNVYWWEGLLLVGWWLLFDISITVGRIFYDTVVKRKWRGHIDPLMIGQTYDPANHFSDLNLAGIMRASQLEDDQDGVERCTFTNNMTMYTKVATYDTLDPEYEKPQEDGGIRERAPAPSGVHQKTLWDCCQNNLRDIEWEPMTWRQKATFLITCPITFAMYITIPSAVERPEDWDKLSAVLSTAFAPVTALLFLYPFDIELFLVLLAIGICIAALVYLFTDVEQPPRFNILFAIMGFVMCIIWMYALGSEIVNLMQTLGIMIRVPQHVLAVTALAWGTSYNDLVTTVAVARQGSPSMAFSAIYGGQVFNLLIGLGVAFTGKSLSSWPVFEISICPKQILTLYALVIALLVALIVIPLNNFTVPKWTARSLILLYLGYMTLTVLMAFNILEMTWLPGAKWDESCSSPYH